MINIKIKYIFSIIFVLIVNITAHSSCSKTQEGKAISADLVLYNKNPAKDFTESTPLGNGLIGAMLFGNPNKDHIILNEISLWTGGEQDADRAEAHKYLPEIQDLFMKGKNEEAEKLVLENFTCEGNGSNHALAESEKYGCYQILGDMFIEWKDTLNPVSDYKRILDISDATASISWKRNGNMFRQEAFTSMADNALIIKYTAPKGLLNFTINLSREKFASLEQDENGIIMTGQVNNVDQPGMKYATKVSVKNKGGVVSIHNNEITISNATECILYCSSATNYNMNLGKLDTSNPLDKVNNTIHASQNKSYKELLRQHIQAYKEYFESSYIRLSSSNPLVEKMSTQERLIHYVQGGSDPLLPLLMYNYGRYLLIGSSHKDGLPANLQGIWAEEYQTPWNCDYHMNVNLQMNYWPAEITGLSELTTPLHKFISRLVPNGQKTAKAYYDADGWVAHVITNPWHFTSPGEGSWGLTMTGGAWMCEHIWEHFRFTRDTMFLQTYYPVLKGAADFLKSVLIEEPQNQFLVTAPSNSPELGYITPEGFHGRICMGPTIDMQIGRELFSSVIKSAEILNIDQDYAQELIAIRNRLAPNRIGAEGDINEWLEDWKDEHPDHHHTSHLYGLFPYDEITPWDTPELAEASVKTLEYRGEENLNGWTCANRALLWARLGEGDRAYNLINKLLVPFDTEGREDIPKGNITHNLFSCFYYGQLQKVIFQIDNNLGFTAAVPELLLQSHGEEEVIRILPALPSHEDWQSGEVSGLRARGAFHIDFSWKDGKLMKGKILSDKGLPCKVFFKEETNIIDEKGAIIANGKGTVIFPTSKGGYYSFVTQ